MNMDGYGESSRRRLTEVTLSEGDAAILQASIATVMLIQTNQVTVSAFSAEGSVLSVVANTVVPITTFPLFANDSSLLANALTLNLMNAVSSGVLTTLVQVAAALTVDSKLKNAFFFTHSVAPTDSPTLMPVANPTAVPTVAPLLCGAGYFNSLNLLCLPCLAGTYATAGALLCLPCAPGYFAGSTASSTCTIVKKSKLTA